MKTLVREREALLAERRQSARDQRGEFGHRVLAERGVGRLVVTGAQTEACIRGTIHAAFTLGYDVTLVGDAHTTEDQTQWGMPAPSDIITLINLCWGEEAAPGRTAAVVDTGEVSFAG